MRPGRDLADLLAAGALSALFFAGGALVPVLGQPLGFFCAAPLIWTAARRGLAAGLFAGALAAAVLLPLLPPPVAAIFVCEHVLPAAALGWCIARGRGITLPSALAALAVTAAMFGGVALLAPGGQADPLRLLEEQLRAGVAALNGESAQGSSPALPEQFQQILALLRPVLPALTLVGIFLECSLNALLVSRLLARAGAPVRRPDLTTFALPEALVWLVIPALGLTQIPERTVSTVALNLLIPLLFAYVLQGLSIALYFAGRAGLTGGGRALLALAIAVFPWLLGAPLLIGLLDFRFGFRGRWPAAPPAPPAA